MKLFCSRLRNRVFTSLNRGTRPQPPIAEPLEQRIVLATFTWSAPGSGTWENSANWNVSDGADADGIPDADDTVIINPATEAVVTVSTTRGVRSLSMQGDDHLAITSGTFTISEQSAINSLLLSGGTLVANGSLTLTGASSWSGNGTLQGTLRNEGTLTISGDPNLSGVLNNGGTILHSGQVDFLSGGRLNNLAGAVFDINGATNGAYATFSTGALGFFNSGTFRHSGTGDANLGLTPFHNLAGGVIEVTAGVLGIASNGDWNGATLIVAAGAELQLEGGTKNWSGAFAGSGQGKVRFTAGTISSGAGGATLSFPAGLFEITGNTTLAGEGFTNLGTLMVTGDPNLSTTLNNGRTILHSGQLDFLNGGRLNNLGGAVFDINGATNGAYATFSTGALGFFNSGTFRHSGTGDANLGLTPFHNLAGGLIEVTAGVLGIASNGDWNGATLIVAAGAELQLEGGTKNWSGAFAGSGQGKVRFTAGTITSGAGGATLSFPAGLFEITGNTTLAGEGFTNLGTLTVTGDPNLSTTLNNGGTILHSGQMDFLRGGRLNNLAGAVFDITGATNGAYSTFSTGALGFFNSGTFRHSGTGDANLGLTPFYNLAGGVIEVTAGNLDIGSSGTWNGANIDVAAGTNLRLNGGTKTWVGNFTGSGEGKILFNGGTLTVGAEGARLSFPTGIFEISGNVTVNGASLTNVGTLQVSGDPNLSTVLINAATILHRGQIDLLAGGRINNLEGAVFDIIGTTNGAYFTFSTGALGFFNSGTLRKSGTISATMSTVPVSNAGTVEVLGGTLTISNLAQLAAGTLSGGTWHVLGGATLNLPSSITTNAATIILDGPGATLTQLSGLSANKGSLALLNGADLTRSGALTNSGETVLSPESVLTVSGNFSQTDGRLELQLANSASSGQFGRLVVTGSATLGGTLAVRTLGNFTPPAGEVYTLMTFASRSGDFAAFEGVDQAFNPVFELVANPDSIRLNSLVAASDLAVTNVVAPTAGFVGKNITISYTVSNLTDRPTTVAGWTDAIYLSRDGVLDASDFLFARVEHVGGLAALSSYSNSITAPVPGALEGEYQVLVVADNRRVAPDLHRANNQLLSPGNIDIGIEKLTFGAPVTGVIAEGQDIFFQIDLASGTDVFLTSEFEAPVQAEFFVRRGGLPTRTSFDFRAESLEDLEQQIRVLNPRAGTYYVMLHGREGAGSGEEFALLADATPFALDSIGQQFGANIGKVTVPLTGFGFTGGLAVQLRSQDGSKAIPAESIELVNRSQAFAVFDLTGIAPGTFDVVALQSGNERLLDDAFTVQVGEPGRLEARLVVPERVRMTRPYTITVEFENRGGTDIPVPLLIVKASANNFLWAEGQSQSQQTDTLQFLGVDPDGFNGGVLRPGEKHVVTLNAVTNGTAASFSVSSTDGDSAELVNYAGLRSSMGIAGEPPRYVAAFDRVVTELGATYGELIQDLARATDEARRLGEKVSTFSEVFDFLIDRKVLELPNANVRGTLFLEDTAHRTAWPSITLRNTATDAFYIAETFLDGSFSFFDVPAGTYALEADGFASLSVGTLTVQQGSPLLDLSVIADPGETLEGRVLNSAGRAVANALVQITDAHGREFLARTSSDGRYRFVGLAPGAAVVDIDVANFIPVDNAAVTLSGETTQHDFTLSSGGLISGRVVSPVGAPVAGAEVIARLVDGAFSQEITSGFDGRFRLGGLPSGIYELVVTGTGFGAGVIGQVAVTNGASTPVADIALKVGGTVSGTVTDALTGLPIAGASFGHSALGQQTQPILSGSTGLFTALNLTPGTFTTLITAPGYNASSAQITLDSGENETLNVTLRPLGNIDGAVQIAGVGAAGLKLTLLPLLDGPQANSYSVVSGANGSFSFAGLPDGQYALGLGGANGPIVLGTFTLNAQDNTHSATLNLPVAELTGILRTADGTPLASSGVALFRNGEKMDAVQTDAQGRYRFLVFQGGAVDVIAAGAAVGVTAAFGVNVTPGQPVSAPDLIAGSTALTLNVEATGDSEGVGGALVVVRSTLDALDEVTFGGFTGPDGHLVLPRIAPGEYEISITKNGFGTEKQTVTISASGATVDFQLDPGRMIQGTVRDAEGRAIEGASVTFVDRATGETFVSYTDAAGNYHRNTFASGSYDVLVSDEQFTPVVIRDVKAGEIPARVDATLAPSQVTLQGVARDASGDPMAGVLVRLLGPGDVTLRTALTEPNGSYSFDNLPSGEVRIAVSPTGFVPAFTTLTLPEAGVTSRDLTIGEAVAIGVKPVSNASSVLALAPSWFFVAPRGGENTGTVQGGVVNSLVAFQWLDGGSGDFATGLQPPSPNAIDTAAFRFGLPLPDEDCPEQVAAHNEALKSGLLLDQAFDAYDSTFDGLKGLNDADVAEVVSMSQEILIDGVMLADGVAGIKGLLKDIGESEGTFVVDAIRAKLSNFEDGLMDMILDFKELRKLPTKESLKNLGDALKDAVGLGMDVNFDTNEETGGLEVKTAVGGDIGKLTLLPIVGDIGNLVEQFNKLNNKLSDFTNSDIVERLDAYEGSHDRYLAVLAKHKANRDKLEALIRDGCGSPGPDPEDPEDQDPQDEENVPSVGSRDPNDIIGPVGFGPQNFVAHDQPLDYTIRFENVATATAAAQVVTITHQLDADVDTSTFQLGDFGFGNFVVDVPAGRDFFETRIDARDIFGLFVDVEAKIDRFTGLATWTFSAIDPETLDLTADPVAGFLPPNIISGQGEGFVSYSIRASEGTPDGTRIDAQATIVFDQNEPINTPAIFHTIDAAAPSTTVTALAETTHAPRVALSWTGSDGAGSGIATYDVFVSDNGGPWTQFLNDVTGTSATFRGQDGHNYRFVVLAEDNVGMTEAFPLNADASTSVSFQALNFTKGDKVSFTDADGDLVKVKLGGVGSGSLILDDPDGDGKGAIDSISFTGTTSKSSVVISVKKAGGDGSVSIGTVTGDGSLGTFNAAKSDLVLNGFDFAGAVKTIKVRDIVSLDPLSGGAAIETGGTAKDKLSITARTISDNVDIHTTGLLSAVKAAAIGNSSITAASLGKLQVTAGAFEADLNVAGPAGVISIKGGGASGKWEAASFGTISVIGGGLDANIESTGKIAKIIVQGGDFTGDLHAAGELGNVSIKADKAGNGGSIADATLAAAKIAAVSASKNVTDSFILAGASLGDDYMLGGAGSAADVFASGTIGTIKIGRDVDGSVIGAGFSSANAVLKDDDDTIVGGGASTIAKLTIGGAIADDSLLAAGQFKGTPKVNGGKVDPATDEHFFLG